ncbi:MAG TPA: 3-isopropylmalate dehydratase small subunit [Caldilineae bacterium]|nr:3-isopropylmalate dehydratase small subunit [Caldilineae bacterium]
MRIQGRVWKYGDNVNTDVIFPGKYTYTITDRREMAQHALEDLDPSFASNVQPGDVIVAGRNWGCGSSREQAAICLKEAGVGAIVAESFARIFYRNALNNGLPAIICPEAAAALEAGDAVEIDLEAGTIRRGDDAWHFPSLPETALQLIQAGGLIPYLKRKLGTMRGTEYAIHNA